MSTETQRDGFIDLAVLRVGMDRPRVGTLAWKDYRLARLTRVTVTEAIGDGRRLEMGALPGDYMVREEWDYLPRCECGFVPPRDCSRHRILSFAEWKAAEALYESPIEVGSEGIGGFAAGQAEETVLTLRVAGFTFDGLTDTATDTPPSADVARDG